MTMLKMRDERLEIRDSNVFAFEKLQVWRNSIVMANLVYSFTSQFPKDEKFGLGSQMRRAAVSITANIAEGNSRFSMLEKARFIEIAYTSLMELIAEANIAQLQNFLSEDHYKELREHGIEIASMLSGFRRNLLSKRDSHAP